VNEASAARRAWVEQIMGLPISIHVRGPDAGSAEAQRAVRAVFDELRTVDEIFSHNLEALPHGHHAPRSVELPSLDELTTKARAAADARARTRGAFDAWRPIAHQPPSTHPLQERRSTPPGSWAGSSGAGAGTWFDPSGLVKGWAVERAAQRLTVLTGHDFYVNAGGDTVLHCARPESPPWRVGIEDPDDLRGVRHVLPLRRGAVATSGSTHRGQHIVDPASGAAADAVRAVTVIGPSLLWADVYATAAVVLGEEAVSWVEGLAGYEAFVVGRAGSVATSGFAALIRPVAAPRADGGRSTGDGPSPRR